MKKEFEGYLGGSYDKLGFWDNKKDAEIGICGGEYLHELLEEFDGEYVKITVEKWIPKHIIDKFNEVGCQSFSFMEKNLNKERIE